MITSSKNSQIESVQKIIKIGSSAGVTLPSKDLKHANFVVGDEVEVIVRKKEPATDRNSEVIDAAKDILARYDKDFKNLAQR